MKKLIIGIWILFVAPVGIVFEIPPAFSQFSDSYHLLNAIKNNDMVVAKERLSGGANANAKRGGNHGLVIAANGRFYEMMRLLLDSGARPDVKTDDREETALMIVAARGDEFAFNLLLEYGADVNLADGQGRTALMKAAGARKAQMVKRLIENGADIYPSDYTGRDALQFAEEGRARSIVKILKEAMAAETE